MDDETRLLRAMARHDRRAWVAMYDRLGGEVFGFVYHLIGGDRAAAEDLDQDVWLIAIERFQDFDPVRGRFRDWLFGIARHRVSRHYRLRTRPGNGSSAAVDADPVSGELPPLELLEGIERADLVRAALLRLPEDRRGVLLSKYLHGLSVAEIATRSGRSAKAIESLLSRARDQIRGLLRPYFDLPSGDECHEPVDRERSGG